MEEHHQPPVLAHLDTLQRQRGFRRQDDTGVDRIGAQLDAEKIHRSSRGCSDHNEDDCEDKLTHGGSSQGYAAIVAGSRSDGNSVFETHLGLM